MIAHHLARPLFRRPFKGYRGVAPRRFDKARFPVLFKARCPFHGEPDAVHEPHVCNGFPEGDGKSFFGHEFRLRRHHRLPGSRLRQFVAHALLFGSVRLGQDEFFHEPLDERRFARPHGTDDSDVDLSARARGNILINAEIFHTTLRCFLVYPMAEETRI